jgi:chemotaxis protein histidine kinase CheA/ActR/RegA family two-component response regulator
MLGLVDVQQVSNQFEANFKLLKEQPQIAVDHQLQSLFLESFGFLAAGIEEIKLSSDPYRKDPATPDPIGDPVFEELKAYLQHLLATGATPLTPATPTVLTRDPAIEQVFGEYVTSKLDQIISLCLQPDQSTIRSEIQQICQKLGNLGENFEFLEWTNLFAACRLAIANPANLLPQLGETISVAVKQAQVLVLAERHQAIGITPDLAELIGNHQAARSNLDNIHSQKLDRAPDLDLTTQKLIGRDNHPIVLQQPQPQPVASFSTNNHFQSLELDPNDRFVDPSLQSFGEKIAFSELEVHSNTELNDFMNLLSDDMPTEGTWMHDDDFFERELPLKDFDESIFFQTEITTNKVEQPQSKVANITDEEETFYNADFEDINQLEMVDFLSTTQLAVAQDRPLFSDLELNSTDRQLQPDLVPILNPDHPAPDFSLDRPMSDLFTTVPAPENWAELEDFQPVANEFATPEILNSTAVPIVAEINAAISANDFHPDLQTAGIEPLEISIDLPNFTDEINSSSSDILVLEELNTRSASASRSEEDRLDAENNKELSDWIDSTIGEYEVDELEEVNLDLLVEISPQNDLQAESKIDSPDDNFTSFDLDALSSSLISSGDDDFKDLDLNLIVEPNNWQEHDLRSELDSSVANDLDGLDFNILVGDVPAETHLNSASNSSTSDDFNDLDFNILGGSDPQTENLTILGLDRLQSENFGSLPDLDFDLDSLGSEIASNELTDLEHILVDLPASNLAQMGDLDALLGIEHSSLSGAGETFDDLDALMMDATPINNPAANLDDLDALFAAAPSVTPTANLDTVVVSTSIVHPATTNTNQKPADRRAKQSRTFEQTMRVSVRHLDNLNNLVGELVVNRNTLEQDQNRMRQFVEKLLSEVQKLNEVGKRMQDLYERSLMENSLIASRQQHKASSNSIPTPISTDDIDNSGNLMEYDPLEMDRFTPIHLLSQKMIELTVRVRESTADIEFVVDGSTEVTRTLRQITGQLQEDLTKSRMVPFAQTADRLQRGVRDNGLKYGKQVELTVEGRDTLIDKVILESLTDPLIHMVNNAIAHGIESIETRQSAGKPSEGKITIRALHQGNQTIISISDDGAGINTERVKQKAIEKGIITTQKAATMTKSEVYDLLFLPSFSTKDQADELAGRGVGMDVVRTSITEIRGTITTESQLGVGTTFTIRLPLALSIAKALIAVNNKNNIAFPMDGIEDTQDVSPEQIQTNSDGEQCIFWRDEMMPFKPLSDLLGFNRPLTRNNLYTTNEDDSDLVSILILRSDGNLMAIQVDKIIGDQEIAIKPLQGPASKPLGIAGATVMGDGRIIPIADVMELIALAKGTLSRHVSAEWTTQMTAPTVELPESMVLIVDDSITVRELLSLTFKRAGYRVEQARDGQEAWDKLRAGLPCDIVFCDIEMPRMDGLEFLSRIQKDTALSKVPVAMLTSRGSDRHRQIAAQLGASGYFIKPYLEEALLDAAKRMIKGEVLEIV